MAHSSTDSQAKTFAECEPPNLCIWRLHGDISEDDIERLYAAQGRFLEGKAFIFVLVDLTHMRSITPGARKAAKKDRGYSGVRATATCGGTFALRSLAMLIAKVTAIVYPKRSQNYQAFDTEEEARAWLAQLSHASESDSPKD